MKLWKVELFALLLSISLNCEAAIGTITEQINTPASIQRSTKTLTGAKGTGVEMEDAIKTAQGIQPLTRFVGPEALLAGARNTISFETDGALKAEVFRVFATNLGPEGQAACLSSLLCCLPKVQPPAAITYDKV